MWPFSPFHSLFIAGDLLPLLPPFERTSLFSAKHSPDTHRGTDADAQAEKGENSLGSGPPLTKKDRIKYRLVTRQFRRNLGSPPSSEKQQGMNCMGKTKEEKITSAPLAGFSPSLSQPPPPSYFFVGMEEAKGDTSQLLPPLGLKRAFWVGKKCCRLWEERFFFFSH